MAIYLLTGNEPYKVKCELDRIRKECGELGVSEYTSLAGDVYEDCRQASLFSDKKAVIVHCVGMPEADGFAEYLEHPFAETDLYLVDEQMDRRSFVYKACKKNSRVTIQQLDKVSREAFVSMCAGMVKRRGCLVRESTLQRLYDYTGYAESEACSLFDISVVIKQMCYQAGEGAEVTPDMVESFATPWQEAVVWELSDTMFSSDKAALLSLGERLLASGESPIAMLSALLRQFRLAYKAKVIGGSDKELSTALGVQVFRLRKACSYNEVTISRALGALQKRVNEIKQGMDGTAVFRAALCETHLLLNE